jgi:hypothetical protein
VNFYPKIDTLYKRGEDFKVTDEFRRPEFAYVNEWLWMEKLDGSNISIVQDLNGTNWRGRTGRSQFTAEVQDYLQILCERWHSALVLKRIEYKLDSIELFGEVIGPKIQNGGIYSDKITSRFYDVRINNSLWLDWDSVIEYSRELDFIKPTYGVLPTKRIVDMVKAGFNTREGNREGPAEGIVAKTKIPLYNNNNDRLIWKLKTKDFV